MLIFLIFCKLGAVSGERLRYTVGRRGKTVYFRQFPSTFQAAAAADQEVPLNTYMIKKTMIESAISRGIREMDDDPERVIRRFVDLGKQFSGNRFQDHVFSVMQELLNNEKSAYYDMVHSLLTNIDEEKIKTFGINFGYMSWAYGAHEIRRTEKEEGFCIPWSIRLRLDFSCPDGPGLPELTSLIEQGQQLGIYAYFIRQSGFCSSYEHLELFERFKDCAFVCLLERGLLTAAQVQVLKVLRNTLVSLPAEDPETMLTADLLRDQKLLFSLHAGYTDGTIDTVIPQTMDKVLATSTPIFLLVGEDTASQTAASQAYRSRLEQLYPCVIMDYTGDGRSISQVLVRHDNLLEIGADGKIIEPRAHRGEPFPFDIPLKDALARIMPGYTAEE